MTDVDGGDEYGKRAAQESGGLKTGGTDMGRRWEIYLKRVFSSD